MSVSTSATRTQEIQDIHHKYLDFYRISGGLSLILIGSWIGSLVFKDGYATNLYTEFISVAATIAVLDQLNSRRAVQERKQALFRQAKSRSEVVGYDDGKFIYDKYWTADTDMTRYTNPEHPDF